jgi:hypothetical protein
LVRYSNVGWKRRIALHVNHDAIDACNGAYNLMTSKR